MAKKKKAVKDPNFVERSIYFYKVVFLPEEPTPSIDWPRLCERISGLSAAIAMSAFIPTNDEQSTMKIILNIIENSLCNTKQIP